MHFLEYILFAGGSLGLLLTIFLFNKKENLLCNRMLGITLLAYSLDIFYALYTVTGIYLTYPKFIGLSGPLPFIYSPALYLYTHLSSENKNFFSVKYLYHFLPVGLMLIAGIVGSFIFTDELRLELMNPYEEKNIFIVALRTFIPFYGIAYLFSSLLEIKKYNHRLKENYSNVEKLKLNWLIYIMLGITLIWLLELIQIFLINISGEPENIAYKYIYAAVSVLMFLVTYKSLKQPEVFSEVNFKEMNRDEEMISNASSSYSKSGLKDKDAEQILKQLLEVMENSKPYLKSNLSLTDLSSIMNVSTHNLSEIINTRLKKSFYDFVNTYRVEEVKRMLKDERYNSSPVLSIAFEAGFNSKSSFNGIFKKFAGVTPTEYRRRGG